MNGRNSLFCDKVTPSSVNFCRCPRVKQYMFCVLSHSLTMNNWGQTRSSRGLAGAELTQDWFTSCITQIKRRPLANNGRLVEMKGTKMRNYWLLVGAQKYWLLSLWVALCSVRSQGRNALAKNWCVFVGTSPLCLLRDRFKLCLSGPCRLGVCSKIWFWTLFCLPQWKLMTFWLNKLEFFSPLLFSAFAVVRSLSLAKHLQPSPQSPSHHLDLSVRCKVTIRAYCRTICVIVHKTWTAFVRT